MVAESALSEVAACRRRGLAHYFRICTPMFARAALRIAGALGRRVVTLGKHPLGWSVHEELLVTLMREVLATRDIGVWRALFSIAGGVTPLPGQVRTPVAPGSRTFWVELAPHLRPAAPRARVALAFVHGGAFVAGSSLQYVGTYQRWLRAFASRGVEARIASVHYRLAPEHTYPAGRNDVEEAFAWLLREGAAPGERIIVGGDSAGGNLALAALARLRDDGRLPLPPDGLLLISPATDLTDASCAVDRSSGGGSGGSSKPAVAARSPSPGASPSASPAPSPSPAARRGRGGLSLSRAASLASTASAASQPGDDNGAAARKERHHHHHQEEEGQAQAPPYWDYLPRRHVSSGLSHYYLTPKEAEDPYASPMYLGSYADLAAREVLVLSGGAELMAPDIRRFASRLLAASAAGEAPKATFYEAPGQVHSWPLLLLPELAPHEAPLWAFVERVAGLA